MSGKLDGELGQNKKLQQELHTHTHTCYIIYSNTTRNAYKMTALIRPADRLGF